MKTTMIWALVIVNAVLLIGLLQSRIKGNVAEAQGIRRPGDYLMLPVDFQGARSGVVVVLDSTNAELSAIQTDDSARPAKLAGMAPIKLTELFDRAGPGSGRR